MKTGREIYQEIKELKTENELSKLYDYTPSLSKEEIAEKIKVLNETEWIEKEKYDALLEKLHAKEERRTPQEVKSVRELKEKTLYEVNVKIFRNNPLHRSFLFMGFHTGGYCELYVNSYDRVIPFNKTYYIEIVRELCKIGEVEDERLYCK